MTTNNANLDTTLRPGGKLDKYDVLQQIGAGGNSVVWKGYDALLDRYVAIKQITLDPEAAAEHDTIRDRFRNEVALQRGVSTKSKHLVPTYDVIDEPRGLFLVMEFVDGPSLEQILAQNPAPMEPRQALGIIGATAMALQAIHEQKIIHRDLKPSNILLPRDGGLKICDFGLATVASDQQAMSIGSVRYMAPELCRGEPADTRADIYSLGVIAYEMLAGREKFNDVFKVVLRDQRNQAMRWMRWHTNVRAKAMPLAQVVPSIEATLSDLVARMMEKDPSARIASAPELLSAIRRHFSAAGQGPSKADALSRPAVSPQVAANPTAPLPKRTRLPLYLGGLLLFWVLVAVGFFAVRHHNAQEAQEALFTAERGRFEKAHTDYLAGQASLALPVFQDLASKWPDKRTGKQSAVWASISQARVDLDRLDYRAAVVNLDRADAATDNQMGERDLIKNLRDQAVARQKFQEAMAQISALIEARKLTEAREQLGSWKNLSSLVPDEAARVEELGAVIADQQTQTWKAGVLKRVADLRTQARYDQALQELTKAERTLKAHEFSEVREQIRRQVRLTNTLEAGNAAAEGGELAVAIQQYEAARQIEPNARDAQDQPLSDVLASLKSRRDFADGRALEEAGNVVEARRKYRSALAHWPGNSEAKSATERLQTADEKQEAVKAGEAAMNEGDFELAIRHFGGALRLGEDAAVQQRLNDARLALYLGRCQALIDAGKLEEAGAAGAEALKIDPENAQALQMITNISTRAQYLRLLAAGDALRRESKFGQAIGVYVKAKKIADTEEVRLRILETDYDNHMAQARHAMATEHWSEAKGKLLTAIGIRDTPEARALLDEIEGKLRANGQVPTEATP